MFQWIGVLLFLATMFVCCASSLLSKDTATHSRLNEITVQLTYDVKYSAQQAVTLTVMLGVFFGMAMAGAGLGLQAQSRLAPVFAVALTVLAAVFWVGQTIFFVFVAHAILLSIICALMAILFIVCAGFAIAAAKEMHSNPPPAGHEILPADYKVPYSHMHQDPPDIRFAAELEQRRRRLEVQQKELEMLEEKIKRRMKDHPE